MPSLSRSKKEQNRKYYRENRCLNLNEIDHGDKLLSRLQKKRATARTHSKNSYSMDPEKRRQHLKQAIS